MKPGQHIVNSRRTYKGGNAYDTKQYKHLRSQPGLQLCGRIQTGTIYRETLPEQHQRAVPIQRYPPNGAPDGRVLRRNPVSDGIHRRQKLYQNQERQTEKGRKEAHARHEHTEPQRGQGDLHHPHPVPAKRHMAG